MENKQFSVRLNPDGHEKPKPKLRLALVYLLSEVGEAERIIDWIKENTEAFLVYRKLDDKPLWVTTEAPRREAKLSRGESS